MTQRPGLRVFDVDEEADMEQAGSACHMRMMLFGGLILRYLKRKTATICGGPRIVTHAAGIAHEPRWSL